MINKNFLLYLLLCLFLASSCEVDFDPARDVLDVPVVYANLNRHDAVHYVRVSRSFCQQLDDGEIPNNNFSPDSIEVWLEVFLQGQRVGHPHVLESIVLEKDTGLFDSHNQLLYKVECLLVGQARCKLYIQNKANGQSLSAECNIMDLDYFNPSLSSLLTQMEFETLPGAFFYEVYSLFHYVEVSAVDTVFKAAQFRIGELLVAEPEVGVKKSMILQRMDLWSQLPVAIKANDQVIRYALERPLEYRILIGDQFLYDWRKSFAINQEINTMQSVSNIQGGFGLFTSYDDKQLFVQPMAADWYDKLAEKEETRHLNFVNHPWE